MARSVTFIHTADLHLGAPFSGLRAQSPRWADTLITAIPTAFQRMIDTAITKAVDFVIIAGDIFDNARPSYADFALFMDGLQQLAAADIPVYCCTGNHDPLSSWSAEYGTLPSNTHLFSAEAPSFFTFVKGGKGDNGGDEVRGAHSAPVAETRGVHGTHGSLTAASGTAADPIRVVLGGRGYYARSFPQDCDVSEGITWANCCEALPGNNEPDFTIGVIHTGLNIDPTRSPVDPQELMRRGLDYWACGHIHQKVLIPPEAPVIAFSGCPQGRAIQETGDHGILLVTLTRDDALTGASFGADTYSSAFAGADSYSGADSYPGAGGTRRQPNRVEFIPTAPVVWQRFEVDVTACETVTQIQEKIQATQFALNSRSHAQHMICRVRLTGTTALHAQLSEQVREDMRHALNDAYDFFFIDAITSATRPPVDRAKLAAEGLFPAVFMNTLDEMAAARATTVAELEQEFYQRGLTMPRGLIDSLEGVMDEAETIVLDLLGDGVTNAVSVAPTASAALATTASGGAAPDAFVSADKPGERS